MEFFRVVDVHAGTKDLHDTLTLDRLSSWCRLVDKVLWTEGDRGEIYCLWGQFHVHREAILEGVRFTLPDCPNAVQWTVTTGYPPAPESVLVHLTINRTGHEPDFIESIDAFLDAWAEGIARGFGGSVAEALRPVQWLPQLGVGALVVRDGAVLLVERARPPYAGEWAVPGGKVRAGETLAEAAAREVREETGIDIIAGDPLFWFEHIQPGDGGPAYHYVVVDLEARYTGGEVRPGGDAADARWVSLDRMGEVPVNRITLDLIGQWSRQRRKNTIP